MLMLELEEWMLGASLAIAIAIPTAIKVFEMPVVSAATAASRDLPDYELVVTAKRLPAACKGLSADNTSAECAKYLSGDVTVEMRQLNPAK